MIAVIESLCLAQEEKVVSPFVKPSKTVVNNVVASPLDSLEFNGILTIGGVTHVSLRDTKANLNYWISEKKAAEDGLEIVRIEAGDDSENKIVVRRGAATKELSLRSFEIVTVAPPKAAPKAKVVTQAKPANAAARNPAIQTASDDEVRERMKKVAEEIRRRRAMRRTTTEQTKSNTSN